MSRLRHRRAPLVGSIRLHRLASGPKAGPGESIGGPLEHGENHQRDEEPSGVGAR